MSEYLTKQEATELLGKSITYLDKRIANGEISFITDPSSSRKKLLLASDIYRIKAERENAKAEKSRARAEKEKAKAEKKQAKEKPPKADKEQDPQFLQELAVKEVRLDILDAVAPYEVPLELLYQFEEDVEAVAKLPPEGRREALKELVHRIIEKHRESGKEAGYE